MEEIELYERSDKDIATDLGRRFKTYRIALRMTQKEIAAQSGVSVMTIVRFENGEGSSIRLDNFIAILRAVQKLDGIAEAIPDIPVSLYDMKRTTDATHQRRVKKRKDEK